MLRVNDMYIDITNIRKIYYEMDDFGEYLVITYAYDVENPTRIAVESHSEYLDTAGLIADEVNRRNGGV